MDLINLNNRSCVERSISFAGDLFTIVPYKDWIVLCINLNDLKTEIVVYGKEFNILKSWQVEGFSCDTTKLFCQGRILVT